MNPDEIDFDSILVYTLPDLLAEVKRLRADYEVIYQAKMELEFESLEQQVLIYKLEKTIAVMRKALNLASDFGAHLWWCVECDEAGWAHDMCEHIFETYREEEE